MKKISLNQNWQFAKGTITMMELMMGEAGNIENIDSVSYTHLTLPTT